MYEIRRISQYYFYENILSISLFFQKILIFSFAGSINLSSKSSIILFGIFSDTFSTTADMK